MLYDKSHFKKVNDKKVLHKVRKHWVTLSLTTLMLLGGASVVSGLTTHASQTGDNSSNNNENSSLNNQQGDNYSSQLVNNNSTENYNNAQTDQLANREKASIDANDQPQGINALNQAQSKFKTDFSTANLLKDNRAYMNDQGRTNQVAQPSVNTHQVKSATSEAEYHNQIMAEAREHWNALGDGLNSHPRRLLGKGPETPQDELANIDNKINKIKGFASKFQQYQTEMSSASNAAEDQMSRYNNVEDVDNPSSADAKADSDAINTDIVQTPSQSMSVDSITATIASNSANTYGANPAEYTTQIANLSNKIDTTYSEASGYIDNAFKSASAASNDAASIVTIFSSEASNANSAGKNLDVNHSAAANYPIVNVTNGEEMINTYFDPKVHHVNIMNNIDFWAAPNNNALGRNVYNYWWVPARNITFNGLNNNGTWNTVDFGGTNVNFINGWNGDTRYRDKAGNPMMKVIIKNMHMYGSSYWGPFSINNNGGGIKALNVYKNITYDGSELSYNANSNTNVVFDGKIILTTGAYSPSGKAADPHSPYGTGYDYDTGGINAHPFAGDTGPDLEDPLINGISNYVGNNINDASNQEDMQISGNGTPANYIEFNPGTDFTGYTSNGANLAVWGSGQINIDNDANVHLIPRGNMGETANLGMGIPDGIQIEGTGALNVDNGATLLITPTDQTDKYNVNGDIRENYYPGAIWITGGGQMVINPGGTVQVQYPTRPIGDTGMRSLPDDALGDGNNPRAAVDIENGAKIIAHRTGKLLVDGGNPGEKAGRNHVGNLVSFGLATDNANVAGNVHAEPGSIIKLSSGGTEAVNLFEAPNGTEIDVNDPKLFQLDFNSNNNSNSQLASYGTGIEGGHVKVIDEHGNDFGQYGDVVFPGKTFSADTSLVQQYVDSAYKVLHQWLINHWGSGNAATVWNTVQNNANSKESNVIGEIAPLYPYAQQPLSSAKGQNLFNEFNHSIDVPKTVLDQLVPGINQQSPSNFGPRITKGDVDWMLKDIGDGDYANDEVMTYDGQEYPIHGHGTGFNLTKGFAFQGVPDTYIEGINFQNNVLSGYSFPGSYIRANFISNGAPLTTDHMYDDQARYNGENPYDPTDKSPYHKDYLAIADHTNGYWSIQLPSGTNVNDLRVTAHTQTVSPANASRRVKENIAGQSMVITGKNHDTVDTANAYDSDPNHIPTEVFNDDEQSGIYDANIDGNVPASRGNEETDDRNAGQDFAAGYIKGEYDRDNLINDSTVYNNPFPFIKGYEIAKSTKMAKAQTTTFKADKAAIDKAIANYTNYLKDIKADQSAATPNSTAVTNTSNDLNQLPVKSYSNLDHTRTNVAASSVAVTSSDNDIASQYSLVNKINTSANADITQLNSDSNNYNLESNSYDRYYNEASLANNVGDQADKNAYLVQAQQAQNLMNQDIADANNLVNNITASNTAASKDNQAASSDSNSISDSAISVQTSASNDIASAYSLSANSYSVAVNSDSSTASASNTSISSKTSTLSSEGSFIGSEYSTIVSLVNKFSNISNSVSRFSINSDLSQATSNYDTASNDSGIAATSNAQLPLDSGSEYALSSAVGSLAQVESDVNNNYKLFSLASDYNSNADVQLNVIIGVNDRATKESSTVSAELDSVNALNDQDPSADIASALSVAESYAQSYVIDIDVDSGIASAESSATTFMMGSGKTANGSNNSMESASIAINDAGDTNLISGTKSCDESKIASAIVQIEKDSLTGNVSDADDQASIAESANENAQSIANADLGVDATRIVPITFVTSDGNKVGCSSLLSGHVGESAISSISTTISAPSGYTYVTTQPTTTYTSGSSAGTYKYIQNDSYLFTKKNINATSAGFMTSESVEVQGDVASATVDFIDEDGNQVGSSEVTGSIGGSADISYKNIPAGYNPVIYNGNTNKGQSTEYTFNPNNIDSISNQKAQMKPYNFYVYANRTFLFDVNAHENVNGTPHCVNTTAQPITGKDGDVVTIDPANFVPTGFTNYRNNNAVNTPVKAEITKNGLIVLDGNGNVITDHSGKPIQPVMDWTYDALNSKDDTVKELGDSNYPQPIYVQYVDDDNGDTPVNSHPIRVDGYTDQYVDALDDDNGRLTIPTGYKVVGGTQIKYQIGLEPTYTLSNPLQIHVAKGIGKNAVVDYVDRDTGADVTQRIIDAPVGTQLSSLEDEYTNELPYSYKFAKDPVKGKPNVPYGDTLKTGTIVPNGQYIVYVTRDEDMPMPMPSDNQPVEGDGRITVNYNDKATGNTISRYTLIKPAGETLNASDYTSHNSSSHYPFDDVLPSNFTYVPDSKSNTLPKLTFNTNQDQTVNINVTPNSKSTEATANVEYYDVDNNTFIKDPDDSTKNLSIQVNGDANDPIDYSSYQQFIPQGYRYAGMGSHDNVIEPNDTDVILVSKAIPAESFGTVTVTYKTLKPGIQLTGNGSKGQPYTPNDYSELMDLPNPDNSTDITKLNNPDNYDTYDQITVSGPTGDPFNLGYFEYDLPSDGDWQYYKAVNETTQYPNGHQNVTIYLAPKAQPYSHITIHFVNADAFPKKQDIESTPLDTLKSNIWTHSSVEVMSGHVGDLFSPEEYEYNTPKNTVFDHIVKGDLVSSFDTKDQDVWIAVRDLNNKVISPKISNSTNTTTGKKDKGRNPKPVNGPKASNTQTSNTNNKSTTDKKGSKKSK